MQTNNYKQIFKVIKAARRVLLVSHVNPDGDAWSASLAMALILDRLGKPFEIFIHEHPGLKFFKGKFGDRLVLAKEKLAWSEIDLIISLDCGNVGRTNLSAEILGRGAGVNFIEIDHHPMVEDVADWSLRLPTAAATCEVLYDLFKTNRLVIDKEIATVLLTGLATDTGNFIYNITSDHTMAIASELLRLGARLDGVFDNTWKNKSLNSMRLWGVAMSRLTLNNCHNIAYTVLVKNDFVETGVDEKELEDLAGFLSGISEAKAFLLLKEGEDGLIKGSLRSNTEEFDVGDLARRLGGGGHARAAGFAIPGKLELIDGRWMIK